MSQESQRTYSVVAEMQDGEARAVSVWGKDPGDAFRQVKGMPGVRRVGKVTEGNGARAPESRRFGKHVNPTPPPSQPPAVDRGPLIGHAISGPRVVLHAREAGGERPFRHLQPPPDRPQPVTRAAAPTAPKPQVAPAPAGLARAESMPVRDHANPSAVEFRVVKSRRRGGEPYLLQRGRWREADGKRAFEISWEKGFAAREAAEEHQRWLEQTERDIADVDQQAA